MPCGSDGGAVFQAALGEHPVHVIFDRGDRDEELGGDVLVAQTLRQQGGNFALTRRQISKTIGRLPPGPNHNQGMAQGRYGIEVNCDRCGCTDGASELSDDGFRWQSTRLGLGCLKHAAQPAQGFSVEGIIHHTHSVSFQEKSS